MKLFFFISFILFPLTVVSQSTLSSAGVLYGHYQNAVNQGDFFEAQLYLDSLLILKDRLPAYNIALIYNNLGYVSWNLGRYVKAENYYNSATHADLDSKSRSQVLQILILNNQGILFKQLGDFTKALFYYEKAKSIILESKDFTPDYFDQLSMVLFNEALVNFKQETFPHAISLLQESRKMKENWSLPYLGSVYYNLARCYSSIRKYLDADLYFIKSIHQWISEKGEDHFELANVYLEYAQFLAEQGEYAKAQEYFQKAIDNYLSNYGPHHPYTASCYNIISDVHFSNGEYTQALEYAQMALESICPGFASEDFMSNPLGIESLLDTRLLKIYTSKIDALMGLAKATQINQNKSSKELLDFAIETTDDAVLVLTRIQDSYLSQESRLFLAGDQKDVFIQGIEVALLLTDFTGDPVYQEKAYQYASFGKALELRYEMRQKEQLYLSSREDSSANKLLEIREDIESYSYLIQSEQNKSSPDSARLAEWKQNRFDFRSDYERVYDSIFRTGLIEGNISNQFADFSLPQIRSKLKQNQTLVEYSISKPKDDDGRKLFAFVINNKKLAVYKSLLDSSFSISIRTILENLHGFDPYNSNDADRQELEAALGIMYNLVFKPVESHIKGGRITIIPDDELALIPFGAFLQDQQANERSSGNKRYLIQDYEFCYLPNSSLLKDPKQRWRHRSPDLKIISQDYTYQIVGGYSNLSAVKEETESILDLMKGTRVPTRQPKKDILNAIETTGFLHFAMHNIPASDLQSSSYMVLGPKEDSTLKHLLFDYEVDPLNLIASMVVLNACESGSGQIHQGEGVLSMARSFLLAGAQSVISAQWPVDDQAGSSINTDFYKRLIKGDTKPGALRKSQLIYLEEATPSFSHPYYWAGYQVLGDASRIKGNKRILLPTLIIFLLVVSISGWWLNKQHRSRKTRKD